MFEDALGALHHRGCRFVVVGSVARALTGQQVHPHDLDVVIDASSDGQERLRLALADLGTTIETRHGWRQIEPCVSLPWEWGFRVWTTAGQIDVITRFVDGTTIEDHDAHAATIEVRPGIDVRVHPTRRVEAA
jgi:hypothetical protein